MIIESAIRAIERRFGRPGSRKSIAEQRLIGDSRDVAGAGSDLITLVPSNAVITKDDHWIIGSAGFNPDKAILRCCQAGISIDYRYVVTSCS